MTPSYTLTLFSEQPDLGPRPTSIAASVLLHTLAIAVAWFSVVYKPPFARISSEHYKVRELDLMMPDEQAQSSVPKIAYPGSNSGARAPLSKGKPSPSVPALRDVAQARPGPQTLIQADLEHPITLPDQIPVPQAVIWAPSHSPVRKVVPPLPQKSTAADVKPSIERPNDELNLADVNISSSIQPVPNPVFTASTTSPVAVHAPQQVQLPPVTSSVSTSEPTPATILSLSNLRMKEGVATLPPVNESVVVSAQGVLAGQDKTASSGKDTSSKPGQGGSSDGQGNSATNQGAGAGQGKLAQAAGSGSAPNGNQQGAASETATSTGDNNLEGSPLSSMVITLPKDGHFSAIIIGDSIQDEFPETAGVWDGRMAYTVYLHVGLSRSWVLQYSLPRPTDSSQGGTIARLEAPWPYNIVRPNLNPGSVDADALMIHGFVNQAGRFEMLSVVFPQAFPQAQFVLAALQKWQFRPALQDGQSAKVEVLLIIPEQFE